jgi:RimJ/RimL family protein N-acetyltransferase
MSPELQAPHLFTFHLVDQEDLDQMDTIRACYIHPKIYGKMTDDFAGPPWEYQPTKHPSLIYLIARDYGELLGFWLLAPFNTVNWCCHTCLLPTAWGVRAGKAAKAAIAWMWEHAPLCQRIFTEIPAYNRAAIVFAKRQGFIQFGVNPRSFQKNGVLCDQVLLGISRTANSGSEPSVGSP